jgi:hypothetical protein
MFGRKLSGWIGKRVTLFEGAWNGEPCLRIWGSPDIEKDMTVVVSLPRRKPFEMTLHHVDAKRREPAPPAPPPPPPPSRDEASDDNAFDGFDGLVS